MRKTGKTVSPSCDWKQPSGETCQAEANKDRIIRHRGDFRWKGIREELYKTETGTWASVARNVLIGNRGESARFHIRYFEIEPHGFSSLEWHRHEHAVICIRGKGRVLMGKKKHTIGYLDTVYIAPETVHQLQNPFDEPFGFFCIVNARRDRPKKP